MGSTVGWMREMPEKRYTSTPGGAPLANQVTGNGTFSLVIPITLHSAGMNITLPLPLPLRNGILGYALTRPRTTPQPQLRTQSCGSARI